MTSVLWESKISLSFFVEVRGVLTWCGHLHKACSVLVFICMYIYWGAVAMDPRQISENFVLARQHALLITLILII